MIEIQVKVAELIGKINDEQKHAIWDYMFAAALADGHVDLEQSDYTEKMSNILQIDEHLQMNRFRKEYMENKQITQEELFDIVRDEIACLNKDQLEGLKIIITDLVSLNGIVAKTEQKLIKYIDEYIEKK